MRTTDLRTLPRGCNHLEVRQPARPQAPLDEREAVLGPAAGEAS